MSMCYISYCTCVFKCRYGDRIVAIKVLNRGSTWDGRAVLEERFIREVNMMSRVKHENLVKVGRLILNVLSCLRLSNVRTSLYTYHGKVMPIHKHVIYLAKNTFLFFAVYWSMQRPIDCYS